MKIYMLATLLGVLVMGTNSEVALAKASCKAVYEKYPIEKKCGSRGGPCVEQNVRNRAARAAAGCGPKVN